MDTIDLASGCTRLATSVRSTVTALYRLQTALINCKIPSHQSGSEALQDVERCRKAIRIEWEAYNRLLESCTTYSDELISFWEYSITDSAGDCLAFLKETPVLARSIFRDTRVLISRHDHLLSAVLDTKMKFSSIFERPETSRRRRSDSETTLTPSHEFSRHAHASLHPNGSLSFSELESALKDIRQSLGNIQLFWDGEVKNIVSLVFLLSKKQPSSAPAMQTNDPLSIWIQHRSALQSSISSISESSDAIVVNAVGAPTLSVTAPQHLARFEMGEKQGYGNLFLDDRLEKGEKGDVSADHRKRTFVKNIFLDTLFPCHSSKVVLSRFD